MNSRLLIFFAYFVFDGTTARYFDTSQYTDFENPYLDNEKYDLLDNIVDRTATKAHEGDKTDSSPRTQIQYEIDEHFSAVANAMIMSAMNDFHNNTCVQFVPNTGGKAQLHITSHKDGCHGSDKYTRYSYYLNLQEPKCFESKDTVVNELMRALEFLHKQNGVKRSKRYIIKHHPFGPLDDLKKSMNEYENSLITDDLFTIDDKSNDDAQTHSGLLKPADIKKINKIYSCFDQSTPHDKVPEVNHVEEIGIPSTSISKKRNDIQPPSTTDNQTDAGETVVQEKYSNDSTKPTKIILLGEDLITKNATEGNTHDNTYYEYKVDDSNNGTDSKIMIFNTEDPINGTDSEENIRQMNYYLYGIDSGNDTHNIVDSDKKIDLMQDIRREEDFKKEIDFALGIIDAGDSANKTGRREVTFQRTYYDHETGSKDNIVGKIYTNNETDSGHMNLKVEGIINETNSKGNTLRSDAFNLKKSADDNIDQEDLKIEIDSDSTHKLRDFYKKIETAENNSQKIDPIDIIDVNGNTLRIANSKYDIYNDNTQKTEDSNQKIYTDVNNSEKENSFSIIDPKGNTLEIANSKYDIHTDNTQKTEDSNQKINTDKNNSEKEDSSAGVGSNRNTREIVNFKYDIHADNVPKIENLDRKINSNENISQILDSNDNYDLAQSTHKIENSNSGSDAKDTGGSDDFNNGLHIGENTSGTQYPYYIPQSLEDIIESHLTEEPQTSDKTLGTEFPNYAYSINSPQTQKQISGPVYPNYTPQSPGKTFMTSNTNYVPYFRQKTFGTRYPNYAPQSPENTFGSHSINRPHTQEQTSRPVHPNYAPYLQKSTSRSRHHSYGPHFRPMTFGPSFYYGPHPQDQNFASSYPNHALDTRQMIYGAGHPNYRPHLRERTFQTQDLKYGPNPPDNNFWMRNSNPTPYPWYRGFGTGYHNY